MQYYAQNITFKNYFHESIEKEEYTFSMRCEILVPFEILEK